MGFLPIQPILSTNTISAQDTSRITLHVDAVHFFQNNEFFGRHAVGYTLPGFYLRPTMVWRVDPSVTLEAGAHWLHFWGARNYPAGKSYVVWPQQDDSLSTAVHLSPWMRADVHFNDHLTLTMGSLHRDGCHQLPLPFYNPERQYATDPESGIQLQAQYKHIQADVWVDWHEFIWRRSLRQEQFTFGTSLRGNIQPSEDWMLYLPVHLIACHVGGQGLAERQPAQTQFNAAAGLGMLHVWGRWKASAECYAAGYRQHNATNVLFKKGWGFFPIVRLSYDNATLDIGYWHSHRFLPLLGSPLFANISETDENAVFHRCRMVTAGARYEWQKFQQCTIALEGRYYNYLIQENASQYSFGIFIDLHPSLTLLR